MSYLSDKRLLLVLLTNIPILGAADEDGSRQHDHNDHADQDRVLLSGNLVIERHTPDAGNDGRSAADDGERDDRSEERVRIEPARRPDDSAFKRIVRGRWLFVYGIL